MQWSSTWHRSRQCADPTILLTSPKFRHQSSCFLAVVQISLPVDAQELHKNVIQGRPGFNSHFFPIVLVRAAAADGLTSGSICIDSLDGNQVSCKSPCLEHSLYLPPVAGRARTSSLLLTTYAPAAECSCYGSSIGPKMSCWFLMHGCGCAWSHLIYFTVLSSVCTECGVCAMCSGESQRRGVAQRCRVALCPPSPRHRTRGICV